MARKTKKMTAGQCERLLVIQGNVAGISESIASLEALRQGKANQISAILGFADLPADRPRDIGAAKGTVSWEAPTEG